MHPSPSHLTDIEFEDGDETSIITTIACIYHPMFKQKIHMITYAESEILFA